MDTGQAAACIVGWQVTKSQMGRVLCRMMSGGSLNNHRVEDGTGWLRERREAQNGLPRLDVKVCSKCGTFSHGNSILPRRGIRKSGFHLRVHVREETVSGRKRVLPFT